MGQAVLLVGSVGLEPRREERGQKEGHHKERPAGRIECGVILSEGNSGSRCGPCPLGLAPPFHQGLDFPHKALVVISELSYLKRGASLLG